MKIPKILTIVTIILFVLLAMAMLGTRVNTTLSDVRVESAATRTDEFMRLLEAIDRGDLADSQYRALDSYNPDNYAFVTYTVALSSFNVLPTEWCILNLSPLPEDVALVRGDVGAIAPLGGSTITATLLTTTEAAEKARNIWAEYYVLGRLYSATVSESASAA